MKILENGKFREMDENDKLFVAIKKIKEKIAKTAAENTEGGIKM